MKTDFAGRLIVVIVLCGLLFAAGCSTDTNPVSGQSDPTGSTPPIRTGEGDGSADGSGAVEIEGRVSTVDVSAGSLSLIDNPDAIMLAPDAEVFQKIGSAEIPISLSDIQVNDFVNVAVFPQADGDLLADRVGLRGYDHFICQVSFKDVITQIDYVNGTMNVQGHTETIVTNPNTFIFVDISTQPTTNIIMAKRGIEGDENTSGDGIMTPISIDHLNVGDTVEVHANTLDAASLSAVAVELKDSTFGQATQEEIALQALLASIDYESGEITFFDTLWVVWSAQVSETTELLGVSGEALTLEQFFACEIVEVRGIQTGENMIELTRMKKETAW